MISLPIGNSLDLSPRAKQIIESVDIIAAEDTRNFLEMTRQLSIKTPRLLAYHEHNEPESANGLLTLLKEGKTIALVSDAGTPCIADPGFRIINLCYANNIEIEPIPGPSSLTTALSVCPIGGIGHVFLGFAEQKQTARKAQLQSLRNYELKTVFLEAPHRILEHLKDALSELGDQEVFLAREMTKKYQEFLYKKISKHIEHFENVSPKGEFVVVYPAIEKTQNNLSEIKEAIKVDLLNGLSSKDILDKLKGQSGLARSDLYDLIQTIKSSLK